MTCFDILVFTVDKRGGGHLYRYCTKKRSRCVSRFVWMCQRYRMVPTGKVHHKTMVSWLDIVVSCHETIISCHETTKFVGNSRSFLQAAHPRGRADVSGLALLLCYMINILQNVCHLNREIYLKPK